MNVYVWYDPSPFVLDCKHTHAHTHAIYRYIYFILNITFFFGSGLWICTERHTCIIIIIIMKLVRGDDLIAIDGENSIDFP